MIRRLLLVGLILACGSSAQAQQRSLFGNRGPLAGPNGFATGSMGAPPAVQGRSVGTGIRYQTGNSFAPTGIFDRQGGSTFGPSGLSGNFSRSLVGSPEAGPSFNRGLAEDVGVPRLGNGLPVESTGVTGPALPAVTPVPSLPAVFPENPIEIPIAPADATAPVAGEVESTPTAPRAVRPELRATGQVRQADRSRGRGRSAARQVRKLSRQERFREVTIGLEEGVWTLRGEVDSFEARDLAEAFASLEPGVGQVRNEIIVRGADVAPAE